MKTLFVGNSPEDSSSKKDVLPRYYIVRLIPAERDCFWNIAKYGFIYNDPFLWKVIYEANKSKLEDPSNPRLIEPGQVFEIPSAGDEKREGTYDPGSEYPAFSKKEK